MPPHSVAYRSARRGTSVGADVGFWHLADMTALIADVRFTPALTVVAKPKQLVS
jgi:hypothetical protein